jgi:hypothetical protein
MQLARVEDAVVAGHRVRVWFRTEPQARGAELAKRALEMQTVVQTGWYFQ